MDILPVEIIKEISLSCELGDLSTFLFTLLSARLFNYKKDKFIYNDYIKRNNKYNIIYNIEGVKLNLIDYDYRFNYNHIVDHLMYLQYLIKIWKERGTFRNKGSVVTLFNQIIQRSGDIELLEFFIKHPVFGPTQMIPYLNNNLILDKIARADENLLIKILLSPQFRPFGPYLHLRDIKKFFNSTPKLYSNYFFRLTPEERVSATQIELSIQTGGGDIDIQEVIKSHGFIPLHVQLIIPKDNLYFFDKIKEDTILEVHEYKSTVNYKFAYEGYSIFSRHINTFVSHINPDGTYDSDIGFILKLSLSISNLPLMILCVDVFIGLFSIKVYKEEIIKIITEHHSVPPPKGNKRLFHEINKSYFFYQLNLKVKVWSITIRST